MVNARSKIKRESFGYWMEGTAFGLADGVICLLGLIIGVAEATANLPRFESQSVIIASGVVGGLANAFGNSIGFLLSQEAERSVQIHEKVEHGENTRVHTKGEVYMSGVLSFLATILAAVALISPFIFFDLETSLVLSFVLGITLSFAMGSYIGKMSGQGLLKTGVKYAVFAIIGALISHAIGDVLNAHLQVKPPQL